MYWVVERSGLPPLTGQAIAILTLLVMILVSVWILAPVTDEIRDWKALAARPEPPLPATPSLVP